MRTGTGIEVDRTPVNSDPFNGARTWQRYADGAAAWYFDKSTRATVNIVQSIRLYKHKRAI